CTFLIWDNNGIKNVEYLKVKDNAKDPSLHNKYIVTYERVTPWAWSQSSKKRAVVKYIGIEVK
ncbi:hypothetical protein P9744_10760, partial [Heyndrickxia coagulans]|nr:hypothetical protein [Heyndrickxia coagulans]